MSIVSITNVVIGRNPSRLTDPFELEITFECLEPLEEDLEWRLSYVGDADDKMKDQELDCVALGPIQRGALRFVFSAEPPDYSVIRKEDIDGITIILLTGCYRNQEFVRVGWYVHNFFPESQASSSSLYSRPEGLGLNGNFQMNCSMNDSNINGHLPPALNQNTYGVSDDVVDIDEMTLEEMLFKMRRMVLADEPRVTRFNIDWDRPSSSSVLPPTPSDSNSLPSVSTDPLSTQTLNNNNNNNNNVNNTSLKDVYNNGSDTYNIGTYNIGTNCSSGSTCHFQPQGTDREDYNYMTSSNAHTNSNNDFEMS